MMKATRVRYMTIMIIASSSQVCFALRISTIFCMEFTSHSNTPGHPRETYIILWDQRKLGMDFPSRPEYTQKESLISPRSYRANILLSPMLWAVGAPWPNRGGSRAVRNNAKIRRTIQRRVPPLTLAITISNTLDTPNTLPYLRISFFSVYVSSLTCLKELATRYVREG
ncbi:hypothetical protein SODALDRAFT_106603 [Sodiomyces alkalinus F11]|uniref:Uncharacterized protein n=1 Tax=Sodiomyces alkalinus (strain CBS 110278 / VKM F-3762 / F11) TaxID=1314773 RepID=A0A3N2Q289_SODAK|nr:hypothetical protein SODALDRAFT_106603 [Sodiomyces alkalinus F11]ROT40879.1 hypothetical protein SODALDRAFT_106603 [Sodiomyces alkalinus F11]